MKNLIRVLSVVSAIAVIAALTGSPALAGSTTGAKAGTNSSSTATGPVSKNPLRSSIGPRFSPSVADTVLHFDEFPLAGEWGFDATEPIVPVSQHFAARAWS